ncbi:MAG: hypothetical protein DDT22_00554 [candidate division WS2 bacterium]|nr:hypothetical protein [Candidatus Lithacetigena glycinireducens]
MRVMEAAGKTVEEATQKALMALNLPLKDVLVEVIAEASSGLFGLFGSKFAKVRVSEIVTPDKYISDFLAGIMQHINISGDVETKKEEDFLKMNVSGNKMGILIGKRGQTLNALQYLLNVAYHRRFPGDDCRIVLDVEDYRLKREETLRTLALNQAKKVTRYSQEVVLEPMTAQERRIIHTALQDNEAVSTFSQGEEPFRKVVIAPKR